MFVPRSRGRGAAVFESLESRRLLATTPTLTGLTLINADTDQPISGYSPMASGAVIDLAKLSTTHLNIRANTGSGVSSVKFGYDSNAGYRTESVAPFAIAGDTNGNFNAWTPSAGGHTVKATPFSSSNATGTAGNSTSISFTVIAGTTPAVPKNVASSIVGTTGLKLIWSAPTSGSTISKFIINYVPGVYLPGAAGQMQSVSSKGSATSVSIANLAPFTMYSIYVAAIDTAGKRATTHLTAWTAATLTQKRYLYLFELPKDKPGFKNLKPQIEVFDVANGNKWVKNIPLPSGIYAMRGVGASAVTGRAYFTFYNTPTDTYQTGGLVCLDLNTNKVLWIKHYDQATVPSPDRFDLTPDGSKIYMPVGENGPDNFWEIINAGTGAAIGKINFVTAPHNTIVSLDGTRVFFEGQEKGTQPAQWKHTIGVVDTATDKLIKTVGPFRDVVRPFTINGKASLIFATVNNFVGFQVGDVASGKVIYTIAPPGYVQPNPPLNAALSHGISLTPDEKQVWVVDDLKIGIHVWDISKVPSQAPTYLGFIKTRSTGQNLAGQTDPNASNDATGVPAWIVPSYDGKYMYPESGEIIDVATRKVVGHLRGKTTDALGNLIDAPYSHSRFMLEVDFDGGKVVRTTNQFGIGRVR